MGYWRIWHQGQAFLFDDKEGVRFLNDSAGAIGQYVRGELKEPSGTQVHLSASFNETHSSLSQFTLLENIEQLKVRANELFQSREQLARERREIGEERDRALRSEKQTHEQFAELKERLALSEAEVHRMQGYIARVQEDDVVREPLVKIGDPEGEQQYVPVRKSRLFPMQHYEHPHPAEDFSRRFGYGEAPQAPPRPRHWVTY